MMGTSLDIERAPLVPSSPVAQPVSQPAPGARPWITPTIAIACILASLAFAFSVGALAMAANSKGAKVVPSAAPSQNQTRPASRLVKRLAFGSCSAYDFRPQPIWTEVNPSMTLGTSFNAFQLLADMGQVDLGSHSHMPPLIHTAGHHPSKPGCMDLGWGHGLP